MFSALTLGSLACRILVPKAGVLTHQTAKVRRQSATRDNRPKLHATTLLTSLTFAVYPILSFRVPYTGR